MSSMRIGTLIKELCRICVAPNDSIPNTFLESHKNRVFDECVEKLIANKLFIGHGDKQADVERASLRMKRLGLCLCGKAVVVDAVKARLQEVLMNQSP